MEADITEARHLICVLGHVAVGVEISKKISPYRRLVLSRVVTAFSGQVLMLAWQHVLWGWCLVTAL